jgi:hypothetical protein
MICKDWPSRQRRCALGVRGIPPIAKCAMDGAPKLYGRIKGAPHAQVPKGEAPGAPGEGAARMGFIISRHLRWGSRSLFARLGSVIFPACSFCGTTEVVP